MRVQGSDWGKEPEIDRRSELPWRVEGLSLPWGWEDKRIVASPYSESILQSPHQPWENAVLYSRDAQRDANHLQRAINAFTEKEAQSAAASAIVSQSEHMSLLVGNETQGGLCEIRTTNLRAIKRAPPLHHSHQPPGMVSMVTR